MNTIAYPLVLQDNHVKLVSTENIHLDELVRIGQHEDIWQYQVLNGTDEQILRRYLESAVEMRNSGEHHPFTIFEPESGLIVGTTSFYDISYPDRKLEIGRTWFDPIAWGRGYNTASKLLLLTYCFEILFLRRVQFRTRSTNKRSQSALTKMGATYEGVFRKDRTDINGAVTDTLLYSILDDEWSEVKAKLKYELRLTNYE